MSPAPFSSTQIVPSTDVIQQNADKRNNYTPQQGRRIPYASGGGG